jgi:predicted membrane-bound mannosyltransferase
LTYGQGLHRLGGESGHEKPWWYYLQLFTWQRSGGLVWEQLAFFSCAMAGVVVAFRSNQNILRWAAVYTVIVATVLSLTPYKTPWHAVHLVPGLALLAAGALAAVPRWWLSALMTAGVVAALAVQTRLVAFVLPADARNPYAYVQSSPDVRKFRALADSALAVAPHGVVRVIGGEYWPLPWYLRGLPAVGYWSTPPAECDGAIVFVSATLAAEVRTKLHGSYRENYLGLRPGVIFVVFTPQNQASVK